MKQEKKNQPIKCFVCFTIIFFQIKRPFMKPTNFHYKSLFNDYAWSYEQTFKQQKSIQSMTKKATVKDVNAYLYYITL